MLKLLYTRQCGTVALGYNITIATDHSAADYKVMSVTTPAKAVKAKGHWEQNLARQSMTNVSGDNATLEEAISPCTMDLKMIGVAWRIFQLIVEPNYLAHSQKPVKGPEMNPTVHLQSILSTTRMKSGSFCPAKWSAITGRRMKMS